MYSCKKYEFQIISSDVFECFEDYLENNEFSFKKWKMLENFKNLPLKRYEEVFVILLFIYTIQNRT